MIKSTFTFLFLVSFLSAVKGQVCFASEIWTPYADAGQGITSQDFDGDGKPDIVATLGYAGKIQRLKGLGTGSFASVGLLTANYSPECITSGDFNNDGKMDVAVNNGMYTATIFKGNGAFGFSVSSPSAMLIGWIPKGIANADFNNDGQNDLALANANTNNVSVLLANGSSYGPNASLYAVGTEPRSVVTADFNGDGNNDIASANTMGNSVSILSGNGAGGFAPAVSYNTDISPGAITTDDFNNDGNIDIVTANCGPNSFTTTISLLLNNGLGGFNPVVNLFIGNYPYSIASGDFNGDNNRDLVVAVSFTKQLAVLVGNGSGSFLTPLYINLVDYPCLVITNDFNMDGKDDIAIGYVYGLSTLLNISNTLSVSASPSVICAGGSATLQVSNGSKNYFWDNGSTDSILVVSPLTTSSYTVSSVTNSNCTNSSVLTVSVSACVGINNLMEDENDFLNVYPNPGTSCFNIESKVDMLINISSISGRVVKTIKLNDSNFHKTTFNELPCGVYFITTQTPVNRIIRKIVVGP